MLYCFGDIVVIEENLIGVIVKSYTPKFQKTPQGIVQKEEGSHDVYVRYFNEIRNYPESRIKRYMVRHKYLEGEEIEWQDNAVNGR